MEKFKIKKFVCMVPVVAIIVFILNICLPLKSSESITIKLQTTAALLQRKVSAELIHDKIDSTALIRGNEEKFDAKYHTQQLQSMLGYSDTRWMNNVFIEGKINSSKSYAVFSATTENSNALDYVFYLPLTTLAWKRIGFNSIILVAGSSNKSFSEPLIRFVVQRCLGLDAVVIHILSQTENAVTISQVGRLFTANILRAAFADIDLVYLITSDADLWPINPDVYRLRSDMTVLSLNSDCCRPFSHRGLSYKMLPMSNVGMRVMTWNKITEQNSIGPKSSPEILDFLCSEFGEVALQPATKGENKGWYLDQMTISIMMKNWTEQYGSNRVMFIPRKTSTDRIDRSHWKGDSSLNGKIDAHMPLKAFSLDRWKEVTPLLKSMYGYSSERYNWSLDYFERYIKHIPISN